MDPKTFRRNRGTTSIGSGSTQFSMGVSIKYYPNLIGLMDAKTFYG